ncbi:TonB-dependent receptor plug [Capnocytophaga ochracea DSM 7271]|uniref:TonB-dependent receptor plug n=1 Tax=Capnocytophaga ochracea (strain ATCC 27872 / DSM 7271 / CCUG 9716 / JCM 12966 / NCTC 12371 / SS31 / VPI 2845) TaxID=521097 RepID=C7M8Q8_CAPOD|nr:SusC/RagA family TonB-linked outer membrane protein [Capnocytophaga ochracea]ACU93437.1 TonB-dependent receptor plug [Capnocytophaga ochracea DSM 7271]UAK52125.1 SusC/RagA family TonB-linked outer membrane protein [Capnocytophaga ochracea]
MKQKIQLLLISLFLFVGAVQAQMKNITGEVLDENNQPMSSVAVVVKNTRSTKASKDVSTNTDGKFELKAKVGDVLEFSFLGYEPQQRKVEGKNRNINFKVVLKPQIIEHIDHILIGKPKYSTALGIYQEGEVLPYQQQKVSDKDLTQVKQANFVNSLDGKVAGLHIQRSATGIGGATKATMRGARSLFGDNNVLYVIDGMPIANQAERGIGGDGRDTSEGISDLNPEDIEEVVVLQGAQAAALYGASAANGVVLIRTKKAESNQFKINLSSSIEFVNKLTKPEFQETYGNELGQYTSLSTRALPKGTSFNINDFYKTGHVYQNAVSISGGIDFKGGKNKTYASLASLQSGGIVPNSVYNRYNAYLHNSTSLLNDALRIDLSGNYIRQYERNQVASGIVFNPIVGLYLYPRGEQFGQERYFERYDAIAGYAKQYWIAGSGTPDTPANLGENIQNPYWIAYRNLRPTTKDRYMFSGKVSYKIIGDLDVVARFRIDNTTSTMDDKRYASTLLAYAGVNGYYAHWKETFKQQYADVLLHYNKNLSNDFSLDVHLGASYERHNTQVEGYKGNLYNINNFTQTNITAPTAITHPLWGKRNNTAFFAIAEIGWQSKIYLTLTGRTDKPSDYLFTSKNKVFSPSVGVSALLHQFIGIDKSILSFAKLRGGYSQVAAPMSYAGLGVAETSRSWLGDAYSLPNYSTDLQLERTTSYEVGLDTQWFNNLSFNATFYHTRTNNQLVPIVWQQAGEVQNQGAEVALRYTYPNTSKGVNWETQLVASTNKNKIVSLPHEIANGMYTLHEGGEIGDIFDANGNKLGSTNPDWLLGWQGKMSYKNFDLNFLFKARLGGIVLSETERYFDRYGVSKASADNRANYATFIANRTASDYQYSATNIRLQEVALTYHFREGFIVKGLKDLSVSLVGHNLLMLYNKASFDPEIVPSVGTYGSGYDKFMLPSIRSYGLNVKMQF